MTNKTDLLKELGWDDKLIQHFMVEDSTFVEKEDQIFRPEVYDATSMTITYNSNAASSIVINGKKR